MVPAVLAARDCHRGSSVVRTLDLHLGLPDLGKMPETSGPFRLGAAPSHCKDLPKQQAAIAYWLSKKYRVAPEPLSALVAEAYEVGQRTAKLDPTLILAIMAVESGFNPFAQSPSAPRA
jgi:hypothetical protein